jgi:uncharacterized protein (DUF1800 family)
MDKIPVMKGWPGLLVAASLVSSAQALDGNGNAQSDVWEMVFGASGLPAAADADGDGWANALESAAGTNPLDGASFPRLEMTATGGAPALRWQSLAGKRYTLHTGTSLDSWAPLEADIAGTGELLTWPLAPAGGREFFKLQAFDTDSDGDGVNDWEELTVGFNPATNRTGRYPQTDSQRVAASITAASSVTVSVYDDTCSERWPDPAVLVLRRSGGLKPLAVQLALGGSATSADYTPSISGSVAQFAAGQRELFVTISAIDDAEAGEPAETVTLTVQAGTEYVVGAADSASATILDENGPSAKEAARFLIQAAFGPDQDSAADADQIPQNVEEVMAMGIEAWIDDQLTRPVSKLLPMVQWQEEQPGSALIYGGWKQNAWWGRAMGLPKLRPDATEEQLPDPLRQRVAFALSQIFVISDRMERLGTEPAAMAHYYDKLLENSFGNFETLLKDVALHPCMGLYLSHLANQKVNPTAKTFPDENFAREVMQLFSIGLWMLNPDGTRILDGQGEPVPTYDNSNITEFARVFTGLSYGQLANGNPATFGAYDGDFTVPMKGWDSEHDLGPKTLLLGASTPARTASAGNTGTATMADVDAAIHCLFNHPNVGPFIGRLLIQRLVTSNPSPAYVGRVSAAFNAEPRGDLGRTVKAILMDPEARDAAKMSDPTFGKLREPFLKVVNFARAFNATSAEGWYYLGGMNEDHVQEVFNAPSVFNFFLPTYSPPGALAQNGLAAPEMQIINASSGVTAPNYFWGSVTGQVGFTAGEQSDRQVRPNLEQEMLLNIPSLDFDEFGQTNVQPLDPDPLLRRLDLVLTGGTLTPQSFQIIREALTRIGPGSNIWDWHKVRLKLAVYLIVCSPEFAVQH